MSVRSLAVNQILQHLESQEAFSPPIENSQFVPMIEGEVKILNQVITHTFVNQKDYATRFQREVNIEGLVTKNNPHLFAIKLPELARKFKSFNFPFYLKDDYKVVLDEHSYIEGVWHFKDESEFLDQMAYLQNEVPEIFRQMDSSIRLTFRAKRIDALSFKYYFMDVISYPCVTEKAKNHNEVELQKMLLFAQKHEYGEFNILEKDAKGQIIRWQANKITRF